MILTTRKLTTIFVAALAVAFATAYQPSKKNNIIKPHQVKAAGAGAATIALSLLLAADPAAASSSAAQISLNKVPPSSISIQLGDLPVVGGLVSGTYSKVSDKSIKDPSIVIKSPKDKLKAISGVTAGHLEVDVDGFLSTHADIDLASDEAGVLTARVESKLIPKLPFKNKASQGSAAKGGKESQWNVVTNMGNGESYYYNTKTGETTYSKPSKI